MWVFGCVLFGVSGFSFCFGLGFEFIMLSFARFCEIGVCFVCGGWVVCGHLVGFGFGLGLC